MTTQLSNLSNWIDPDDNDGGQVSYFPLLIQYVGTKEQIVVKNPTDLVVNKGFLVIKTNYEARN